MAEFGPPPGLNIEFDKLEEPMKVHAGPDPEDAPENSLFSDEMPSGLFMGDTWDEASANLSAEHDVLAWENARLAWENAMLREQAVMESWWQPTDPWAAAQAAQAGLQAGVIATLHSLKNSPELNGVSGYVEYWHAESGRWVLRLPNGEEKFAKPENLVAADPFAYYPMYGADKTRSRRGRANGKPSAGPGKSRATGNRPQTNSFGSDVSTAVGSSAHSVMSGDDDMDADAARGAPEDGIRTTVMMRNIPNNYTREMLLELLNKHGFAQSIDLLYLPIDFQTEVGLGYAFINLVSEKEVDAFRERFHGFSDWAVASQKVCEITWSDPLQGIQAHIDRYRNSPVMHESVPDSNRPMLFKDGLRVDFPPPTKRIRAPRLRRPGQK